jgi:hypothetical protein
MAAYSSVALFENNIKRKKEREFSSRITYALQVGQLLRVPGTEKVFEGPEFGTTSIDILLNVIHTIVGVMLAD